MAATHSLFLPGVNHILNGAVDWDTDAIKLMLTTSAWTPNQDTHDFRDDVTNEIAGTGGYTTGGVALAGKVRTKDDPSNEIRLDADDVTWVALTPSAAFRYGAYYKARGGAASADELIGWVDFGADQNPAGSDFIIQYAATGIFKAVVT